MGKNKKSARLKKLLSRIASKLQSLRSHKNWTQEQVAEKLGCDLRWYQRIESGEHQLSLETLTRLAHVFGIEEKELLEN